MSNLKTLNELLQNQNNLNQFPTTSLKKKKTLIYKKNFPHFRPN